MAVIKIYFRKFGPLARFSLHIIGDYYSSNLFKVVCVCVYVSVCVCVPLRKICFPVDWKLLIEESIVFIGIPLVFDFVVSLFFCVLKEFFFLGGGDIANHLTGHNGVEWQGSVCACGC